MPNDMPNDLDPDLDIRLVRYWRNEMDVWLRHARQALEAPGDCAFALKCLDMMETAQGEYISRALRLTAR